MANGPYTIVHGKEKRSLKSKIMPLRFVWWPRDHVLWTMDYGPWTKKRGRINRSIQPHIYL